MQSSLASLETKLNEMFVTKAPVQIPEGARKWIAAYAWVFVLIGAVLGVFGILTIFSVLGITSVIAGSVVAVGAGVYLLFAWLALAVLVVQTILEVMAISPLKVMKKKGWDLIFYSTLISIAYSLFDLLRQFDRGFALFGFLWSLAISIIVLYVLFQVRSQFMGTTKSVSDNSSEAPKN